MTLGNWMRALAAGVCAAAIGGSAGAPRADGRRPARPPNFVLVLCDNLGYADLGCFGSNLHRTPHVDRLAAGGTRFTHAYAASGVCTPSRAALMTGCYPRRVGLHLSDTGGAVLQPVSPMGLHPDEVTLAELLGQQGYATACIGKWHLGDQPPFLPTRQGFDRFFGIPYSDDMTPRTGRPWPPLPLMRGERVVEAPADRDTLTRRYTEAAVEFLRENRSRPFFLYLAQAMPGSTMRPFASEPFRGRSANGPWGDSVEELDWSLGQITGELRSLGLERDTLVLFTNDNGAPRREPPQGRNHPLGGWGYSTDEGGMRVPLIASWPGRVPARRTSPELVTLMDLFPTLGRLAGAEMPRDRVLDGKDFRPLLLGRRGARSPHRYFFYYQGEQLQAVRDHRWKLRLPLEARRDLGSRTQRVDLALYDLHADPGETRSLAAGHPGTVRRLLGAAERARQELGDTGRQGRKVRPPGLLEAAYPLLLPAPRAGATPGAGDW